MYILFHADCPDGLKMTTQELIDSFEEQGLDEHLPPISELDPFEAYSAVHGLNMWMTVIRVETGL